MTVARPATPPAAILLGIRNASSAHAVITIPTVISAKSRIRSAPEHALDDHAAPSSASVAGHAHSPPASSRGRSRLAVRCASTASAERLTICSSEKPSSSATSSALSKRADVQRVVRVGADRDRRARCKRGLRELTLSAGRDRTRAVRVEAVVVELEDHVVANRRRDDRIEIERELVLVAGMRDLVDKRVGHDLEENLGVADAIRHVETGGRVKADRNEVEPLEDESGRSMPLDESAETLASQPLSTRTPLSTLGTIFRFQKYHGCAPWGTLGPWSVMAMSSRPRIEAARTFSVIVEYACPEAML